MNGNYYAIDIWGLIAALVMVLPPPASPKPCVWAWGRTLLWSACRACCNCARWASSWSTSSVPNNPWLVLLLVAFMLIAAVQITLSRRKVFRSGWLDTVFLSLVVTMLIMISLVTELIIRPQPWYAPHWWCR